MKKVDKYVYYAVYFKKGAGYFTQTFSKEMFRTKGEVLNYLKFLKYGDIKIFDNYEDLDNYIVKNWWDF